MFNLANGKMEMHACVSLDQDFRPILLPAFKDFLFHVSLLFIWGFVVLWRFLFFLILCLWVQVSLEARSNRSLAKELYKVVSCQIGCWEWDSDSLMTHSRQLSHLSSFSIQTLNTSVKLRVVVHICNLSKIGISV